MLAIALVVAGAPAQAAPDDLVARPLVLDEGGLDLRLTAEIGVRGGHVGQPLSLAPDAWWGVARGWLIAVHTGFDADLVVLRDGSHSPFGVAVTATVSPEVDVTLEAGWDKLFGPQYNAKSSAVLITACWHR